MEIEIILMLTCIYPYIAVNMEAKEVSYATKADLLMLEEKITKRIEKAHRSILYTITEHMKKLHQQFNSTRQIDVITLHQAEEIFNVGLPVSTYEEFCTLDTQLTDETKLKAMVCILKYWHTCSTSKCYLPSDITYHLYIIQEQFMNGYNNASNLKEAISCILTALLKKNVQLMFSGEGRVTKGNAKKNFSACNLYMCMRGNFVLLCY